MSPGRRHAGPPSPGRLAAGALALALVGLAASLTAREPRRGQRRPAGPPTPSVRAPIAATTAPTPSDPAAATESRLPRRPARRPAGARRAGARFLGAFAALLYGRGDPEALPDASPAIHQQADGAPDLAGPGRAPHHRLRGPWFDPGHPPASGDVTLHAEIADPRQVLEVDLELAPAPGARDGWTVVGLGW